MRIRNVEPKEPIFREDDDLPEGWVETPLASVLQKVPNFDPEAEPDRLFSYVDIGSIDNHSYTITEPKQFYGREAPSRSRRPIKPDDVLFSNVRTYLRNVAIVPSMPQLDLCSTGFSVLRTNGSVDPRFLFFQVLSDGFLNAVTPQQTGSQYPATSESAVREASFRLPPLPEQRRIVEKVEALLARVNAARARLARAPALLKAFRQAVLSAACSGKLTEDWRDEASPPPLLELPSGSEHKVPFRRAGRLWGAGCIPEITEEERENIPQAWTWAKVGQLGTSVDETVQVGPMSMQSKAFSDLGIPVLNVGCIQSGFIDESKLNFLPEGLAKPFDRYRIREGDLLFTRSGTVGRCAIAGADQDGYLMTFHLLRVRTVLEKCLPAYLLAVLQGAPHIKRQTEEGAIGSTRAGFNTRLLAALDIPLPSLREQHEIVRRVDALFALADSIEAKLEAARKRADALTQAILAKAFRGELVPTESSLARAQGRPYESAARLLESVHCEKAAEPPLNRTRKKVMP